MTHTSLQVNVDLVGTAKAAAMLKVHPATVTRMVLRGELQAVPQVGRALAFKRSDVEALAVARAAA